MIRGHHRNGRRGQALVEFALVLPILLLLIFGLIDLGRAIYVNNSLAEAAREGVRWGSVQARSSDTASVETHTLDRLSNVPEAMASATCILSGPAALGCRQGDVLEVTVETDLEMITPGLAQLLGAIGLNPLGLSATSQAIIHN